MSLFKELKRRNVIKVGIAYLVAAWLLMQMGDTLAPALRLPEWVNSALAFFIILGFPLALIFAWAFEMTPEGLKAEKEVDRSQPNASTMGRRLNFAIMALLVLTVVYFVLDKFAISPQQGAETVQVTQPATEEIGEAPDPIKTGPDKKSIAVLPFTNMSPDPDNEYFADGISEELLNVLVDIEELRVPSRTSSFAFKGQNRDIRDIASQLEVEHVLEGSVRKAGDRVRITAQLIEVSTDTHLWSETYDRKLEDIFAIQDEIAGQIIDALKIALSLEQSQAPTTNLGAYTLYLQGRELFRRRGDSLREADRLLREAVELDPEFAEAWGTLAIVHITIPGYTKEPWAEFVASTLEFAERALELDPTQADAMLAIGQTMIMQGKLTAAYEQFEAITRLNSHNSQARLWYALLLFRGGYATQALEQLSTAMDLDPVHSTIIDWFARVAEAAGKPELVVESAERAIQLGRQQGRIPLLIHYINEGSASDMEPFYLGDSDKSRELFPRIFEVRDDPRRLSESLAWADQFEREGAGFVVEYGRFFFQMVAGSPDDFFRQLNQIQPVDDTIDVLIWIPAATRHRQSEAMKTWARSRGLEAHWRARGWPDRCRPVGDDDWECD